MDKITFHGFIQIRWVGTVGLVDRPEKYVLFRALQYFDLVAKNILLKW